MKVLARRLMRAVLPLEFRKYLALWIGRQQWVNPARRGWLSVELIQDYGDKDINAYHKFLWGHHLSYAAPYEVDTRFGVDNIRPSRKLFFAHLLEQLMREGISLNQVRSVYEVGCSLGYQLRYMETELFPCLSDVQGIDIDEHAIRAGREYLRAVGSKVELIHGDMQHLEESLGDKTYDIILCCGVLMYLKEADAALVVRSMLRHSRGLVGIAGLAHPTVDNRLLKGSTVRSRDRTFIHNIEHMIEESGGVILSRRWDGDRLVDEQSIYFVFAARGR